MRNERNAFTLFHDRHGIVEAVVDLTVTLAFSTALVPKLGERLVDLIDLGVDAFKHLVRGSLELRLLEALLGLVKETAQLLFAHVLDIDRLVQQAPELCLLGLDCRADRVKHELVDPLIIPQIVQLELKLIDLLAERLDEYVATGLGAG